MGLRLGGSLAYHRDVAACVRLLALFVAVVCLTASTQTGSWHGPLDIAGVGEGHSRLPDRPYDELIGHIAAVDDAPGCLPSTSLELAPACAAAPGGVRVVASWVRTQARCCGPSPRGPPAV